MKCSTIINTHWYVCVIYDKSELSFLDVVPYGLSVWAMDKPELYLTYMLHNVSVRYNEVHIIISRIGKYV